MRKIGMSFNDTFANDFKCAKADDKPAAGAGGDSSLDTETEDTVVEEIKAGNLINEDVAKAAAEEIKKRNKDRNIAETVNLLQRSKYLRLKQRLILRRNKQLKVAAKALMTAFNTLDEDLKAGKHTKTTYDIEFQKAVKQRVKDYAEADAELRVNIQELQAGFPGYYSYQWDCEIDR